MNRTKNDEIYHPVHLHLTKAHIRKLATGGGVRISHHQIHDSDRYGGSLTHLPLHMAKKARRTLKNGKAFHLKLDPHHIEYNSMHGLGFWSDVVDFGKKAVNVVANDILPVLNSVLDVLPINHPYFVAAKTALKMAEGVGKKIDAAVNKKDQLEEAAEQKRNEALDLEEKALDLTAAAKDRTIASAQKTQLLAAAAAAKQRIAQKKAEAKALDQKAKIEAQNIAKMEKDEAAAKKKAQLEQQKAVQAANRLRK